MTDDTTAPAPDTVRSPRSPAVPLLLGVQLLTGIVLAPSLTFFPVYLKEIGLSAVLISGIATVQRVMALGSSLAGGALVDTIGAKRTLVAGQVFYFAAILLFLARGPWPIALIWAVYGIGMGPTSLGSTSYLIEKADRARLGLLTALLYWGTTLGGAIGNPLAAALLARTGWRGLVPFTGLPAVVIVLVTAIALPRSVRTDPLAVRPTGIRSAIGLASATPPVRLLAWMRFLPTICYGMLLVFVPLLLRDAGASTTVIALYGTAGSVCASLAQLVVGRIADRTGWKAPTAASYSTLAAAALMIAAFPNRLWIVFAGGTAAVASAWSLSTLLPVQMTKAVEPSAVGRALGFIHLFWNLAMILAGLAGGVLFETWNGLPFLVGGAASAAGLIAAGAFARLTATPPREAAAPEGLSSSRCLRSGGRDGE